MHIIAPKRREALNICICCTCRWRRLASGGLATLSPQRRLDLGVKNFAIFAFCSETRSSALLFTGLRFSDDGLFPKGILEEDETDDEPPAIDRTATIAPLGSCLSSSSSPEAAAEAPVSMSFRTDRPPFLDWSCWKNPSNFSRCISSSTHLNCFNGFNIKGSFSALGFENCRSAV